MFDEDEDVVARIHIARGGFEVTSGIDPLSRMRASSL
jgi:hypothetical protein